MTTSINSIGPSPLGAQTHDPRVTGALGGGLALGALGAAASWKLDRMPRLAVSAALTGVLAGAVGGAILTSGSIGSGSESRLGAAGGGAVKGAAAGAVLLAGAAGILLPPMTSLTRFAAMREFALHGALAGGIVGLVAGAVAYDDAGDLA